MFVEALDIERAVNTAEAAGNRSALASVAADFVLVEITGVEEHYIDAPVNFVCSLEDPRDLGAEAHRPRTAEKEVPGEGM